MSIDEGTLLPKIKQLVPIYEKVKEAIFLAEYENKLELPLASINELRNCLDHLMRTFANGLDGNTEHEIIEAKAHLYRAGNDSYEILVMHKLENFYEYQKTFDKEAVKEIFPDYYTLIIPLIEEVKVELAKVRAKKPVMHQEENTFTIYENIVTQLIKEIGRFQKASPGIIEYEKTMRRKGIKRTIVNFIIGGVAAGLVVGLILLCIEKKYF